MYHIRFAGVGEQDGETEYEDGCVLLAGITWKGIKIGSVVPVLIVRTSFLTHTLDTPELIDNQSKT